MNALIAHCGDSLSGIGGVARPGIVHRLDKDTTGLLVVAKTDQAHKSLAAQFADHGRTGPLERGYMAIAWGTPARSAATIVAPLARSTRNREKIEVKREGTPGAREAITHYEVVEKYGPADKPIASLIECRLETGRTHQIRVHLAHIGNPLVGDRAYGSGFATKSALLPEPARTLAAHFPRQALHAYLLGFEHPVTGEEMTFESELPEDMQALAEMTQPGPFHARTHELGDFVGVRENGKLIAMAGERMRVPGFTEISAVCTHPDARGRGLAAKLMRIVAAKIVARGEQLFLHVYPHNKGAISVYEKLGFRHRADVQLTVLRHRQPGEA